MSLVIQNTFLANGPPPQDHYTILFPPRNRL